MTPHLVEKGIDFFTIQDLHYNSKGVIQFSEEENFEDLKKALQVLISEFDGGDYYSKLEQYMLNFFLEKVEPKVAYIDNDINQVVENSRKIYVAGKLKEFTDEKGLFVRLGVSIPGEKGQFPSLQALYLAKNQLEIAISPKEYLDRWFYQFTNGKGYIDGAITKTKQGIESLSIISKINDEILSYREANFTQLALRYPKPGNNSN